MKPVISVVVPVFNEEAVVMASYARLRAVLSDTGMSWELIFVDDGSRDKTFSILEDISDKDANIRVLTFSRNFGHQAAITAGMEYSSGEAVIVIDADLQDPPELIPKMIEKWREGYDVVYGRRVKRNGETLTKKATASIYYRLLRGMTDIDIPVDAGDFRLISRKVCDVMNTLHERGRYIRGMVSWIGFKQCALEFNREERAAGETKYTLRKMIKLSVNGITSFSQKPLSLPATLGILSFSAGVIWLIALLITHLTGNAVNSWTIVLGAMFIFHGTTLIMIGIQGVYIGRVHEESKGRPNFIVKETRGFEKTP